MKCESLKKKMHEKKIAYFLQTLYTKIEAPFTKQKEEGQKGKDDNQKKEESMEVFFLFHKLEKFILKNCFRV